MIPSSGSLDLEDQEDRRRHRERGGRARRAPFRLRGANSPKLQKITASQKTTTTRNASGIVLPIEPNRLQRAPSRSLLASSARARKASAEPCPRRQSRIVSSIPLDRRRSPPGCPPERPATRLRPPASVSIRRATVPRMSSRIGFVSGPERASERSRTRTLAAMCLSAASCGVVRALGRRGHQPEHEAQPRSRSVRSPASRRPWSPRRGCSPGGRPQPDSEQSAAEDEGEDRKATEMWAAWGGRHATGSGVSL